MSDNKIPKQAVSGTIRKLIVLPLLAVLGVVAFVAERAAEWSNARFWHLIDWAERNREGDDDK
jgi:hypothetical protein